MMKLQTILLSLLLPAILCAQNSPSFEMYISSNYTSSTNNLITAEKAALTYNFGLGFNIPHNDKIDWTIGMRFADFSTKYSNDNLRWGSQHNGMGGFDPNIPSGEDLIGISYKNHNLFLEMPLGVKYSFSKKRMHFFLEPSLNPALFLIYRNDIEKRYDQQADEAIIQSGRYTNARQFNIFGELGLGITLKTSQRMSIHLRPSARIQLLNMAKRSSVSNRLYSMGVKMGVNYRLK